MKKTYLPVSFRRYGQWKNMLSHTLLTVVLFLAGFGTVNLTAQGNCSLSCHGAQVSLDQNCMAEVTHQMISDTSECLDGDFTVYLIYLNGDTVPTSPFATEAEIGMTLIASVYDENSTNSCWAFITIEDKLRPQIECNCPPGVDPEELPEECFVPCTDLDLDLFPGPIATDNCSDPDSIDVILLDETVEAICDPLYIKRITRRYTAIDEAGNRSDTCEQVLYSERIDFGDIMWPDSFSTITMNPFECTDPFTDNIGGGQNGNQPDGIPDPIPVAEGGAGVPTINGIPVFPDFMFYCNAQIAVEDVHIGPIGCVRKVMRMWTAYEWHCSGERDTLYIQLIEIVDTEGPEVECPEDITTSTDFHDCDATVYIPRPFAIDSCHDVVQISVSYPGGFTDNVPVGGMYLDLPVGDNLLIFTAYDECYNSTTCEWTVTVVDLTPPVPVCDLHTIVSLTDSGPHGLTKVPASVFDDGSYDECGPVTFLAQRMDSCIDFDWTTNGAGIDEIPDGFVDSQDHGTTFRPKVPFACCDVGAGVIMVALQVTDASGNSNTCMVEVEVQDKLSPIITCPPDITISCTFDFAMDDLSIFGTVRHEGEDREEICIFDPENPAADDEGFTCWGIDGVAHDNCDVVITEQVIPDINSCGIGVIERVFRATDPGGRVAACIQRIYIENFDPFYINPENPLDPNDDVIWPISPFEAFGCGEDTEPEVTGFPIFTEDECDLIGYTYEDQVFEFVTGACLKILRTWEVIDWCQFEQGTSGQYSGYWTFTQVIKVINTDAPEFTTEQPDIIECNEFNCDDLFIELVQEGEDDCTPDAELRWEYHIDFDNDMVIDYSDSGLGAVINASRNFPIGSHRVIYSFEDGCSNKTTVEQFVTVLACKPPSPICINGLSADLMPVNLDADPEPDWGMITLWASDFDKGSYHACGYPVTVSFSADTSHKSMIFDCDDLGPEPVPVQLWVTDLVNGLQAFCSTYIIIQDNMGVCPEDPEGAGLISGTIATEATETVKNVEVNLVGSTMTPAMTNPTGNFSFPSMPYGGSYEVKPGKNDEHKNGVSSLDLVKIQKHLLGIELFDSPYKRIAADANNSKSISAIDIIELRKLILGIYTELPSMTSWRFVDAEYNFIDPANPFSENFPESYVISGFNNDMNNVDFVGIKIGDVNNTVQANAQGIEVRSNKQYNFAAEDRGFSAGETVDLEITADNFASMLGYQFTMQFDHAALELSEILPGALDMTKDFFGLQDAGKGYITGSWTTAVPVDVENSDVLFTVRFTATGNGQLSKAVSLNSLRTNAEAYDVNSEEYNLTLRFNGVEGIQEVHDYALFQNTPNPFNDETLIGFSMAEAGKASITVFDVQGKVVLRKEIDAKLGYNTVTLNATDMKGTGVLYYQLESNGFTATRKMIKM